MSTTEQQPNQPEKPKKYRLYIYIISGILVTLLWIVLFICGLLIDSSYYRAALNYGFADLSDWVWTTITFTLSNVALLAFLAGLLGGICSLTIATEGFTLGKNEIKKKIEGKEISPMQIENPFLSSFRGVFVFVGILTLQYVSSFSDLGSIGRSVEQGKIAAEKDMDKFYLDLLDTISDSISKENLTALWEKREKEQEKTNNNALLDSIFKYKIELNSLKKDSKDYATMRKLYKEKIDKLRRNITVPAIADIPGMSSYSYFQFAIIVSLMAFVFGYDPRRFAEFISNLPLTKGKS
jgi:hypothetical protein